MPNITEAAKALNEQRIAAMNEANQVLDTAIAENRAVTAEEREKIERLDATANELVARVQAMDDRERREHEAGVAREAFERQHGTTEAGRRERSEGEELRAWAQGRERRSYDGSDRDSYGKNAISVNVRAAAMEKDLIRRGYQGEELRALLWDTGSVASAVPTTLARTLYEYMEASVAAFRMPTTKITTDSGEPMQFPRVNAHGIATQVIAQGTAIGGTDPTFARMQLDAYKYGQLVQIANEVIQDSGINIVEFIGRNIGRAIGRVVDADLVVGTGTGEPQGMMTALAVGAAGTVATGGSLIQPTVEKLIDLVYSVNDEYRASGNAAFLMRDASAGVIRKYRDGAGGTVGAFLWEPSLTAGIQGGQPDRLLGYPVYTDPNVASMASAARVVAFGDWSAYYIRQVGDVVIERSDEYAFNVDEATFRGKWRVDGDYIDLTAVNLLQQAV
jgi:HK97 family phage major capsid protein